MNERIKQLILQAGFILDDGGNDFHVFDGYEAITCTEELKKFAELIVRECVEQGKQVQSQTVTNVSDDYVNGRAMGIEVFMNQIKENFGVE